MGEEGKTSEKSKTIIMEEMAALNKDDREFRKYLQESLSPESDTYIRSHATIVNWRKHGKLPPIDFLEDILGVYPANDRRYRFALKMLALIRPHVWGHEGFVWKLKKNGTFK